MKTLFKNAVILTGENFIKGNLLIEDDIIKSISESEILDKVDFCYDMEDKLLMPGLVNAHGHSPMTLLRGVGSDLVLQDWLHKAIFPIEDKLTFKDIQVGAQMAMMEMIAGGTTTFSEMYDFPRDEISVIEKAGMKCNIDRCGLGWIPSRLQECIDFVNNYKDPTDKIRAEFCIHSEYQTTDDFVRGIVEANKKAHVCVNIHASESKLEHEESLIRHNLTPIQYFNSFGVFDEKAYLAHCVWATDEDFAILKEKNVSIVHNPSANLKLGSGIARVKKALDMGINVALGTDGPASNNQINMFKEMHIASLLQKGVNGQADAITAMQAIKMATVNGAKALGRDNTGVLKIGKKADIIALDLDKPHLMPNDRNYDALICYAAEASDVCMTIVDGKILYKDGEFTTLDYDKIKYEFKETVNRIR